MKIENIVRHPRAADGAARNRGAEVHPAAHPANQPAGCVLYVGKPFARWADIRHALAGRNLDVIDSGDPAELLAARALARYDLIVVGEGHALREPHEICIDIRRQGYRGAVLLIAGASDPIVRILALENGADAWVDIDADARSCVAQMRALLRRPAPPMEGAAPGALRVGTLVLNPASREVAVGHARVDLTTLEFNLLWLLARHAGEIMPREELAQRLGYKIDAPDNRTIDTAVSRLRHRLGDLHARRIRTIRSVGYMLCADSLFDAGDRGSPPAN